MLARDPACCFICRVQFIGGGHPNAGGAQFFVRSLARALSRYFCSVDLYTYMYKILQILFRDCHQGVETYKVYRFKSHRFCWSGKNWQGDGHETILSDSYIRMVCVICVNYAIEAFVYKLGSRLGRRVVSSRVPRNLGYNHWHLCQHFLDRSWHAHSPKHLASFLA